VSDVQSCAFERNNAKGRFSAVLINIVLALAHVIANEDALYATVKKGSQILRLRTKHKRTGYNCLLFNRKFLLG
jgi:hypothetical protein